MTPKLLQKIKDITVCNTEMDDQEILYQLKQIIRAEYNHRSTASTPISELIAKKLEDVADGTHRKEEIETGFEDLDKLIGGFHSGEFVVVGARPAMGKTAFLLNLAQYICKKFPVLYISFDFLNMELINRFIMAAIEIDGQKLQSGELDSKEIEKIHAQISEFQNSNLFIQDNLDKSISALREKCEQEVRNHGIKVLFIDYLQLITSYQHRRQYRELEVAHISRELKSIAKELNICIIASSQLSRALESRWGNDGKRPLLSDLRESGSIEQDADKVLFIHRPEYYAITVDNEGNSLRGIAEIIVAKNRTGKTGNLFLRFVPQFAKFENIEAKDTFAFAAQRLVELDENCKKNDIVSKLISDLDLEISLS